MKQLFLILITAYQNVFSPLLHQLLGQRSFCRYQTTCSTYARQMIIRHGAIKGGMMAVKRFLSCQPFIKPYAAY